jgi:hypothetical protein
MVSPLRPELYRRLVVRSDLYNFGEVKIVHDDEEMDFAVIEDWETGRKRLDVHLPGEYYVINCLAAETLVVTSEGDRPICDLVGRATLLVPNAKGLGNWREVEVRAFGRQRLWALHLRRGRVTKTIRVTADHRWLVSGRLGLYRQTTTRDLQPGERLPSCFARTLASYGDKAPAPSAVGIMQGFTFGDGSHELAVKQKAAVTLFGAKEKALLPYFQPCRKTRVRYKGKLLWRIEDLPRSWKQRPSTDESLSFLLGWLAGYFAADGHISKSGRQAVLCSSRPENLEFAKAVCYQLGVRVSPVRTRVRVGFGVERPVSFISLNVLGLPEEFWLLAHHRRRAAWWRQKATTRLRASWVVTGAEPTDDVEEVFCAVVPGVEKFTLADNLLTMNCPYCYDTRHRLWINHRWGLWDPQVRSRNLWLCCCYNEGCLEPYHRQRDLYEKVFDDFAHRHPAGHPINALRDGVRHSLGPGQVKPPGPYVYALHHLDEDHHANVYLRERGYDTGWLGRAMQVGFCPHSYPEFGHAQGRIIIPVFHGGAYVGWQARYPHPGEPPGGAPKYYTMPGMRKTSVLYNYDNAAGHPFVVLTEGATKVWSTGPWAVAQFGDKLSSYQATLITGRWKTVVIYLDGNMYERAAEAWYALHRVPQRVLVRLPEDKEPGDYTPAQNRYILYHEALRQGVQLPMESSP